MSVQLVAIDLDGTLIDSVDDLHMAVVSMQTTLGLPQSDRSQVCSWVGNGIVRLVHRALTLSMSDDAPAKDHKLALLAFKKAYHETNGKYATLYPGVIEGLEWLLSLGVPMSIITNKAREFTEPLIQSAGINHYFAHIVCADDVARKKPASDPLLRSASLANALPEKSVLIGDSITDFKAARNASFKLIGVSYGYSGTVSPHDMTGRERPDEIIESFEQLPLAINRLF